VNDSTYTVPSASLAETDYTIDVNLGICSCQIGCDGAFCKHQAILHKHLDVVLPNLPPINLQGRYSLGKLALGNKCPDINFFKVGEIKIYLLMIANIQLHQKLFQQVI
jgi:hypothetical protein